MERDLRMEADGVKAVQWDQIIMRRIDAENKLADLEIEKWGAEEESTKVEGGEEGMGWSRRGCRTWKEHRRTIS